MGLTGRPSRATTRPPAWRAFSLAESMRPSATAKSSRLAAASFSHVQWALTAASPHDSKMFPDLMDESDRGQAAFGDSAYVGQEETLQKYGLKDEICEKGYRGKPLTDEQREENRKKSSIRSRVEHVFGFMEGAMHGLTVRTIGIARAATSIFLKCLTYNMFRYEQFVRNGIR